MSRAFVKDGDQESMPIVTPRAFLPNGVANYVTVRGMQLLVDEKQAIVNKIEQLSGNEDDKRVQHNFLTATLSLLEERIRTAIVVNPEGKESNIIAFGAYVTIVSDSNTKMVVHITGADEAKSVKGAISYFSPLAKAVIGHSVGDEVEVNLPQGVQQYKIVAVSYNDNVFSLLGGNCSLQQRSEPLQTDFEKGSDSKQLTSKIADQTLLPQQTKTHNDSETDNVLNTSSKRISDNSNEIFPIVNERGVTIGKAQRWQCHNGSKLLHPVVHLFVFNSKGELYLQHRPKWKDIQPDKWDTSVGGHIGFGEKTEEALFRESFEELGIKSYAPTFLKSYLFESPQERELVYVYTTIYDGEICMSDELDGGRFWSREEIVNNIGKKIFTPNFEHEYKRFFMK